MGQKFAGVVVSPKAKVVVSAVDRELLEQFGAAVVEASWNRIEEVPFGKIGGKCERLCKSMFGSSTMVESDDERGIGGESMYEC